MNAITNYRDLQKALLKQIQYNNADITIIPIRSGYKSDKDLSLTSVALLPAQLSKEIYQTIIKPLKKIEPDHHYYSPNSMHITIKSIRTCHDPPLFTWTDIEKVHTVFDDIIPKHRSFSFSFEEVVSFPTSVSLIGFSDESLKQLVLSLDGKLKEVGVPDNKKYISNTVFFGNITLCRYGYSPSKDFICAVKEMRQSFKGQLKVETIYLAICDAVFSTETRKLLYSYRLSE